MAAFAAFALVIVALIAAIAARVAGREQARPVSGAAKDVVATVMQFETALANRDWADICTRLYSSGARAAAGGARCPTTLAQSAGGLRDPHVKIISVGGRGEAATVTVSASGDGQTP